MAVPVSLARSVWVEFSWDRFWQSSYGKSSPVLSCSGVLRYGSQVCRVVTSDVQVRSVAAVESGQLWRVEICPVSSSLVQLWAVLLSPAVLRFASLWQVAAVGSQRVVRCLVEAGRSAFESWQSCWVKFSYVESCLVWDS